MPDKYGRSLIVCQDSFNHNILRKYGKRATQKGQGV